MDGSSFVASDPAGRSGEAEIAGVLHGATGPQKVSVGFASRVSLFVSFLGAPPPGDQTAYTRLTLTLPRGEVELTACRLHTEYTRIGYGGRLVFVDDVYDFEPLFREGTLVNLKGAFRNLSLVQAQKDKISPAFRDFTAAALYDFSVYKKFFNEQDRILENEPPYVAEAARTALVQQHRGDFFAFFDRHLVELGRAIAGFDREAHERHGFYFRRQAWELILGSEVMKRTNLRPRGYAGDAEMMEMLYENRYLGTYVFNRLMHKHPVEAPAAQAVRNRRQLIPRVLREVLARFPGLSPGGFRFMSVASGPAAELQDLFLAAEDFALFHCTLLDQDLFALGCAREAIERIEASRGIRVRVDYLNHSVRTMLRDRDLVGTFGRHHFIYSMGLFDYLTPPVGKAVLTKIYDLLLPGGTLVVGNYHVDNPSRFYMEYWLDWVLYHRTNAEMLELASGCAGAEPAIRMDGSGCQMFLHLTKPG
jgi:extracellular factor (EF) 3-hydroxypalmitic acid methyl ester biosynthesis protein